jgi:hypothetical protein
MIKAIITFAISVIVIILGSIWIYDLVVTQPRIAATDAYYESYGCYISDGGSAYTCPNGLPPPRK